MTMPSLREWADKLGQFAIYPGKDSGSLVALSYCGLGLCGEAGEVAEKLKKLIRDNNGVVDDTRRQDLAKELGDVMWYWLRLCCELGLSPDDVVQQNLDKLSSRLQRGVVGGSGDNR